ncbi:MAG: hypothetical protein J6S20_00045 [Paludibacteraceae bacterium]|nr:hypothetical protein [Paludibacteraceae bacterium]
MEVIFTKNTHNDFQRHRDYLRRTGKSDGHNFQKYELDEIGKSLKKNIKNGVGNQKEHKKSIFPKKFEYNYDTHKMYIDKKSHHVVFYTIKKTKNGDVVKIEKCIHSVELKKELDKRGIKPLKSGDKSLLDDLETIYKEDDINLREENEGKKEEVIDPKTGKKTKKVKHTGPRGGHYYINDKGEHIYPEEWNESLKNVKSFIKESKMVSLIDFLKKMVG